MRVIRYLILCSVFQQILNQNSTETESSPLFEHTEGPCEYVTFWNSFLQSFSLILISELADNTLILCLIFSTKLSKLTILSIACLAMVLMNLLSIGIGYSMPFLFYGGLMDWIAIIFFSIFGVMLINDAANKENLPLIHRKDSFQYSRRGIEDRKDSKLSSEDLNILVDGSDHHTPLISDQVNHSREEEKKINKALSSEDSKLDIDKKDIHQRNKTLLIWTFFSSLAIGQCGSKSQLSTIIISSVYNIWGVILGTTIAHILCILLAVYAGSIIGKFVTERILTYIAGFLFMVFSFQLILIKFNLL
jgi:putative Ca2+/H+ antiporter (TMEM165/GDT1 family)